MVLGLVGSSLGHMCTLFHLQFPLSLIQLPLHHAYPPLNMSQDALTQVALEMRVYLHILRVTDNASEAGVQILPGPGRDPVCRCLQLRFFSGPVRPMYKLIRLLWLIIYLFFSALELISDLLGNFVLFI